MTIDRPADRHRGHVYTARSDGLDVEVNVSPDFGENPSADITVSLPHPGATAG